MSENREIINCSLEVYPVESIEVNNPTFEESGSITIRLLKKVQIGETSMNRDTLIIRDIYSTLSSETISKKLMLLCSQEFTEYWVATILHSLEVHPHLIDWLKTGIVSAAVHKAVETNIRGLKQFGLMADIEVTTIMEVVREREELDLILMQSMEDLEWVLMQSMEEMNLNRNPASKSSIEKLKRDHFEGGVGDELVKNCAVCLDDFVAGSEVISMPCSHMFHGGCLLRWLEESNSCPLCRLELPV